MEITRQIRCQGCGETGQAVWDERAWHPDVQPERVPLRVTGPFSICVHGPSQVIACGRCQQIMSRQDG